MKDNNLKFSIASLKKYIPIFLLFFGVVLIFISHFSETYSKKENSNYPNIYETDYANVLENKLKNVLESITGKDTVNVMITFESTYDTNSYDEKYEQTDFSMYTMSENENVSPLNKPTPKIGGVMIVCSSISNPEDISTIKKAASTALNIKESKIYIIGGVSGQ